MHVGGGSEKRDGDGVGERRAGVWDGISGGRERGRGADEGADGVRRVEGMKGAEEMMKVYMTKRWEWGRWEWGKRGGGWDGWRSGRERVGGW